ncbi:sortase [Pseudarthrobacter sp. fls2-241-R2A-168]|uniref:sortase domain-containing protein n=1 Tax=Pseudarthrobacter sp. fls2-241-R2A-168 TaxID=3040304 RepID=UPI0025524D6F|nr:sortase [Pseudarthrobacter sp. fls2-241-R2A-168]
MNSGHRWGLGASTAAGLLLLLAVSGCAGGSTGTPDAGPAPSVSAAPSAPAAPATPGSTASSSPPAAPAPSPADAAPAVPAAAEPAVLSRSEPVTLEIPAIGLTTGLIKLGLLDNGSLEVPEDKGNGAPASWYNGSPTPGERGPSVVLGHVNALGGHKGVFADLRQLRPGSDIIVLRADGSSAVFSVDHAAQYSKDGFPTLEVYGNTPGSELRLVTCDGYDPSTGRFNDNYVIYAKLKT